MKISIVMASFLGPYSGAATKRKEKLERAIQSVIKNTHTNWELIIVSDGCHRTNEVYNEKFAKFSNIKLIQLPKQELFSGSVRQAGVDASTGELICFLDSDDRIGIGHLENLATMATQNSEVDWFYYNDYLQIDKDRSSWRDVGLKKGSIGTSSIAYRKSMKASWEGCDGYGHDWTFIERLIAESKRYKKIFGCGYYVYHYRTVDKTIDI